MKYNSKQLFRKLNEGSKDFTAIDLFCGCGGLTTGLKKAGFKIFGAVDIDPLSVRTYKENHPEVTVIDKDIREIDASEFLVKIGLSIGQLDLLAGCPPCQGFSTLRTLNGAVDVNDPRNDLLGEFERFVELLLPRAIMIENVPGLADDFRFEVFCQKMKKLGYIGNHCILNASEYGVPQRRKRLIYLAGLGMTIPFGRKSRKRRTVRDAIGKLGRAGSSGDSLHDLPEKRSIRVQEMIRLIPKDGGSRQDLPEVLQLECHKRCNGFKDVYGRMAWDDVAPTITSGCFNPSKGRFLHPEEDRAITMREAALLQGFPLKYKFPSTESKISIALMIGNALPPAFIFAQGLMIKNTLKKQDKINK